MNKLYLIVTFTLLACTEAPTPSAEIGHIEQALCANIDGVPSAMAALAVATASELGRWQPARDFTVSNGLLALTATGKRQCDDGRCWNTQAILDLQRAPAGVVSLDGVDFDGESFRSELTTDFREQQRCESGYSQGRVECSGLPHELTLESTSSGTCATVFTFRATAPNGKPLANPEHLASKLRYSLSG